MRALVTGATGFAGSHLVDDLLADDHQVFGLIYAKDGRERPVDHPAFTPIEGDLLNLDSLHAAVGQARPDVIYHLAGWALTARSWSYPARTIMVNTAGTANLLQAAVEGGSPRVVAITSAEIYGTVGREDLPITEATKPEPRHPYGVSKWAASRLIPLFWQRFELPVVEARPFNHIGPRQEPGFVVPDFASQLAAIKLGMQPPTISVGNLSAERDFTDVRDVVRAYRLLAEEGRPGETYLICSGQPVPIHYLLNALIELGEVSVEVRYDPERMRPSDTPVLFGSYDRLGEDTGWQPRIHLRTSLRDTFDYWIERLQAEAETPEKAGQAG
ncbi:MAG: GDP-mannose 4,6-dehydratase [Candidatus Promineifilaceae bacterium]|nr:GDP-mannose 4,6-dehydratase [Candidatus Promineifilaceae bacterium]